MSKRGADEYITKENGSTPNTVETKVQMATAAQLAKRKMAAPKGRLNRSTPGVSPSSTTSNPFATSFGAPAQPQQSQSTFSAPGGISFGENKSFPAGASSSGGAFNFTAPQSNSFTFGQSAPNNPFASVNGNGNSNGTGFQQINNSSEDAMMESPQKKPVFGGFGNNSNGGVAFSGFGSQTEQPSSQPSFGTGQPQTNGFGGNTSTSMFGQSLANQGAGNMFGHSAPKPETAVPFGQTNGDFGQSSTTQQVFNFGQPTASAPAQGSGFSFGQNKSQTQSQPPTQPSSSLFSFGQPAQAASVLSNDSPRVGQNFGAGEKDLVPQPVSTNTLFGAIQQNTPTNNIFSGFGGTKSTEVKEPQVTEETPTQTTIENSWAESPASAWSSDPTDKSKSSPFASLFGTDKKSEAKGLDVNHLVGGVGAVKSYGFSAPSQPTGLFGGKPVSELDNKGSSKPLFDFQSAKTGPPSNMFSSTKADTNKPSASSLFGKPSKTGSEEPASSVAVSSGGTIAAPDMNASLFSFAQAVAPKPLTDTSNSLFGSFKPLSQPDASSTPATAKNPATSGTFDRTPAPYPVAHEYSIAKESSSDATPESIHYAITDGPDPKRTIYSNPPTRIPPWLGGDKYKSYDSNYRLHSLNREFQRRIASLDPSKQDFENILRSYVAARESIGESVGLYTRSVAGMKRKNDTVEEDREEPPTAKRIRGSEPSAQASPPKTQSTSSIFQPVPASASSGTSNLFGSFNPPSEDASPVKTSAPSKPNTSSLFKSMIPEGSKSNESSSQKPVGNPFAGLMASSTSAPSSSTFSFGGTTASTIKIPAADSTTPPSSPPKASKPAASGFTMPRFTAPSGGNDFLGAFGKSAKANAEKFAKEAKAKRKAEEFDSDEDDEDAWNKKYDEEERAKRVKIEEAKSKVAMPSFGVPKSAPSPVKSSSVTNEESVKQTMETSQSRENDDDAGGEQETDTESDGQDDLPEDAIEADAEESEEDDKADDVTLPPGKSLFDRITRDSTPPQNSAPSSRAEPAPTSSFKTSIFGKTAEKSTPEAPAFSPITPSTSSTSFIPSKVFSFTPTPKDNPSPSPGASLFDGGAVKVGPIPGEGLFGSRSGTPVNGDKPTSNPFGGLSSSQSSLGADHTWKKGFDIKFGTSAADAPSVNITAPSPQPKESMKPFGSLFGAASGTSNNSSTPASLGFTFGSNTSAPAPGFLGASSHLAPTSATSSAMSSRATSPGGTDNESVATDNEDAQSDPQASLINSNPGEEDEDVLYECRAKVMKFYTPEEVEGTKKSAPWNTEGLGPMRILKNRNNGRTRIVVRADPGANIIINSNLMSDVTYTASTWGNNGAVKLVTVNTDNKPETWTLKVKNRAVADELATVMENNKVRSSN